MVELAIVILYLGLPALVLFLCHKIQFLNRIGSIVLSYAFGLLLGIAGLLDERFHIIQEILMSVTVPLAIPLLLFSSNVRDWKKLAAQPLNSLLFSLIAVFVSVVIGFLLFNGPAIEGFHKVGGMLVGIYSGGTPNLASLKMILDVNEEVYLAVHSYDMAIGAVYLFFLMGLGRRVFQFILPKHMPVGVADVEESHNDNWLSIIKSKHKRYALLKVLFVVIAMVAFAGGVMYILPQSLQMVVFIFLITALGIWGSSIKWINQTKGTFDMGMYLILIFSVVVSSKVQIGDLSAINPSIFGYITFVVFASLLLHVLLSRLRNIDADTVIVTSAALICSPPFVPVVAGALRNRSIIVPGLTIGLIGYALGNYLGYLMALLLSYL
ncbi:DUF819 family protein [Carboxylicivirga marina]|uniref:DUF819 family protein n=1 Tax=Carboxylicivirga marina TaxID=2800988 RepID=A0ABS1HPD1_9BACT|nr:DUF819 family protein [Carboxylicivirga marina]MBK3519549.1 DUF819 family protein [Carboxylicivirga marina]